MTHKAAAGRIFITLLTDSVQQMLKLNLMMDAQFQLYQQVLGVSRDDSNWILSSQFAESVFAVTCRAILIGSDDFSDTGYTRVAMYLWDALQTHSVMQGYIELDFIARPEVNSVVVEHLTQTRVPMTMHQALKDEMVGLKTSVNAMTTLVKNLEYKMSRQAVKLLQDVKELISDRKCFLRIPESIHPNWLNFIMYPLSEAGGTLKRKGIGYSLTGITSGIVKKRQVGKSGILAAFSPKIGLHG
jgi:hypothetical protein